MRKFENVADGLYREARPNPNHLPHHLDGHGRRPHSWFHHRRAAPHHNRHQPPQARKSLSDVNCFFELSNFSRLFHLLKLICKISSCAQTWMTRIRKRTYVFWFSMMKVSNYTNSGAATVDAVATITGLKWRNLPARLQLPPKEETSSMWSRGRDD